MPAAPCPFVAGPMLTDSRLFVGRRDELRTLVNKMRGAQPVSVNVVGERLLGKSSLLYHFMQTWEQRLEAPARFTVVYVSLRRVKPKTAEEFYQALSEALLKRPAVRRTEPLRATLARSSGDRKRFAAALDLFAEHELLPVFCLDDFEKLLDHPDTLNKDFYDRLRGLMDANRLMLILASRRPVKVYGEEYQLKSAFFNIGHTLTLTEFSREEDAEQLVALPLFDSDRPALDTEDRRLALRWGGRRPCWLQLAGTALFEARQSRKNTAWARKEFQRQRREKTEDGILSRLSVAMLRKFRTSPGLLIVLVVLVAIIYGWVTGELSLKDVILSLLKLKT